MSFGTVLSLIFGTLSPAVFIPACICELRARRMSGRRNPDTAHIEKLQTVADACLVAAWILLAIAYACFKFLASDAAVWQAFFENWMTWALVILVVLDIIYLYIRRSRPRKSGGRKHFWEV